MAGRIPQAFFDQLLGRIDLVELIHARIPLRRSGQNMVACCPFHAEKTPSFTVHPRQQFYYCFGCTAHGNAIDFLMNYERLEFLEAVEDLARIAGLEVPRIGERERPHFHMQYQWLQQAERFFCRQLREHPTRHQAINYLQQRGVTGESAKYFAIGYAPPEWDGLSNYLRAAGASAAQLVEVGLAGRNERSQLYDRFRQRIMFPIRDRRGRTIAFGGRALDNDTAAKYLNSPETPLFSKRSEVYGLHEARQRQQHLANLLVVEGYLDVVMLAQYGFTATVATLGTAISSVQVERLLRLTSELIFCFDGDRAGQQAAWRALESALPLMRDGRVVRFLHLPPGSDPDSLVRAEGHDAFAQRVQQAQPLADYLFASLQAQLDTQSLEGRAQLAALATPLLERLPAGYFRDLLEERLQRVAQLPQSRLTQSSAPTSIPRHAQTLTATPLRKALALLLYQPQLLQRIPDSAIAPLREREQPGLPLLLEVLDLLRDQPQLATAALLERYRATPQGEILQRLAQWSPEPEVADQFDCVQEFADIMQHLQRRR